MYFESAYFNTRIIPPEKYVILTNHTTINISILIQRKLIDYVCISILKNNILLLIITMINPNSHYRNLHNCHCNRGNPIQNNPIRNNLINSNNQS